MGFIDPLKRLSLVQFGLKDLKQLMRPKNEHQTLFQILECTLNMFANFEKFEGGYV
jgi:hypothetical protein